MNGQGSQKANVYKSAENMKNGEERVFLLVFAPVSKCEGFSFADFFTCKY